MLPGTPEETLKKQKGKDIDSDTQRMIDRAKRQGNTAKDLGGTAFEGCEQRNVEDILDKEYALVDARMSKGRFGEYVIMHLVDTDTGEHISVATGGAVVVRKVEELQEKHQLPSLVVVTKVKDYYDFI